VYGWPLFETIFLTIKNFYMAKPTKGISGCFSGKLTGKEIFCVL
jgi:hypothetical protein